MIPFGILHTPSFRQQYGVRSGCTDTSHYTVKLRVQRTERICNLAPIMINALLVLLTGRRTLLKVNARYRLKLYYTGTVKAKIKRTHTVLLHYDTLCHM
jgi:hypothetical protein